MKDDLSWPAVVLMSVVVVAVLTFVLAARQMATEVTTSTSFQCVESYEDYAKRYQRGDFACTSPGDGICGHMPRVGPQFCK